MYEARTINNFFKILNRSSDCNARLGKISTSHGAFDTPCFMPVGSQGSIKTLTPQEIKSAGVDILLSNTYHLYLRPGMSVFEKIGGLHRFMEWPGPILTDSGGYQVFSLARLCNITDEGVVFRSHIDGSKHLLTPELVIGLQHTLGSDISMVLDQCPPSDADLKSVSQAVDRTFQWAKMAISSQREDQILFGIVQGGLFPDLRKKAAEMLGLLDFPGYAIGGLSLGESKNNMLDTVQQCQEYLPHDKPRYLMGVGTPEDIVRCVSMGIDMFDSALPTRIARNGALITDNGRINIRKAEYKFADNMIDSECDCYTCRNFTAAYLHHLFRCEELLAYRLATIHNVRYMMRLMSSIRNAIVINKFNEYKLGFLDRYRATDENVRIQQKQKWIMNGSNT